MLQKIITILSKYTKADPTLINQDTVLTADLGLSSYDVVSLVTDFEDEFDIEIPDKDIKLFQTVNDIVNYIEASNEE